jgi:ferrous iron transport protein A
MEFHSFTLNTLSLGCKGVVDGLTFEGVQKFRMTDLGFVPGAIVKALHRSPAGDPTAYYIMGAVIALRSEDASKIILKPIESK